MPDIMEEARASVRVFARDVRAQGDDVAARCAANAHHFNVESEAEGAYRKPVRERFRALAWAYAEHAEAIRMVGK